VAVFGLISGYYIGERENVMPVVFAGGEEGRRIPVKVISLVLACPLLVEFRADEGALTPHDLN
jgi:hypothetical protein